MIAALPKHLMQFRQGRVCEIECWKCGAWITADDGAENGPFAAFAESHIDCTGEIKAMKIGYARVSTNDQNLDGQTDALRAAGAEKVFTDRVSGMAEIREGFDRMRSQLREGDCVIVHRLDRLARSLKQLIEIAADFEARGVQLVLLTEGIDTTTSGGKLFFHIFGAVAEFERNLIVERTHAGLASARARGRKGGRPKALDADKEKTVRTLLAAAKKKKEHFNFEQIGRSVGASERTIRRFAIREKYL